MRIDLVLKFLCLAKSRSSVKNWCEKGLVLVNGKPARASSTVHPGDQLTIHYPSRTLTIDLRDVPEQQLSKAGAPEFYDIV
jgi:ribosomal 50S subunit-recycling heat shock protein